MKPAVLGVAAAAATVGVLGIVLVGGPRTVKLPVYEKPVEFFEESRQALLVGNLPHGVSSLSAEACASCHRNHGTPRPCRRPDGRRRGTPRRR